MPRFITESDGDREGYDRTPGSGLDAAQAQDARLQAGGALMGIAGTPVQVRNHEAKGVSTQSGVYMTAPLRVAGFAVIEAPNLEGAIGMIAQAPCAVAYGMVEVWPLLEGKGTTRK